MKNTLVFALVSSIVFLSACGDPVIDASTNDTMTKSYKKMYDALPDEEKKEFQFAYGSIIYSYRSHRAFRERGDVKEVIAERIANLLDGRNADQILKEYSNVRKTRGLWGIQTVEKQIANREDEIKQLERVKIDGYDLYVVKDGARDRMILDAVIFNGSRYKLSSAAFSIRVGSKLSDTLWPQMRSIYVKFPEGLEQGSEILRTIDLGHPTSHRYLPQGPVLSEHSTSRITGGEIDITVNNYPAVSDLEKILMKKKSEYQNEFGKIDINQFIEEVPTD